MGTILGLPLGLDVELKGKGYKVGLPARGLRASAELPPSVVPVELDPLAPRRNRTAVVALVLAIVGFAGASVGALCYWIGVAGEFFNSFVVGGGILFSARMIWVPAHILAIVALALPRRRKKAAIIAVALTMGHLMIGLLDLLFIWLVFWGF